MLNVNIDMSIPNSCANCSFLRVEKDFFQCLIDKRYMYDEDKLWLTEKRPNWCPIKVQESLKPINDETEWVQISPAKIYECKKCGQHVMTDNIEYYKFCHGCGRAVKQNE